MLLPDISDVKAALERIAPHLHQTPLLHSQLLDQWLGHRIIFKADCLQKTGSFKARGGINTLGWLRDTKQLPETVVANSSGNHAQGVAFAAKAFGLKAEVFAAANISAVKAAATRYYGAKLHLFDTRPQADNAVKERASHGDCFWMPPFNHAQIVAGQGTSAWEAIHQCEHEIDALFTPCGGGGLTSGTLLSARHLTKAEVIGVEPLMANDAARSLRAGRIIPLDGPAKTLADGAATPSVGDITFEFLKQLDGFYEADEWQIAYWTQWLQHLLKIHVEPTCAMTMVGVCEWLKNRPKGQTVMVFLSGGNIDHAKMTQLWQRDYLSQLPSLDPVPGDH